MVNRKKLAVLFTTGAMTLAAVSGCSSSSSTKETTSAAPEKTTEATTTTAEATTEEPTTEAPAPAASYTIEAGKVIDFEDGNFGFALMNVQTPVSDDSTLSIADFNGSKALKVSPKSTASGMTETIGFDVSSILGDKVGGVKKVAMQIAVEAADGQFHACTGNILQKHTDASGTGWVVYIDSKNPNEVIAEFDSEYDASEKNVLLVTKNSGDGNNSDTAYGATGAYSTLYIDNIVFFGADDKPIDVDTTVAFDAPDGFGEADWSNLIKVTDQTIIPGFAAADIGGWNQAPDWIWNIHTEEVNVQEVDADGNPVVDADGNPVYVQKKDADGNPMVNEDGEPVYETESVESGNFDFGSIMKPGTVFTLYFSSEPTEDLNQYIWFVMQYPDYGLGWNRILDAPTAAGAKIARDSDPADKKGHLFAVNDSFTMAQVTYEEIVQYIADTYAGNLPEGVTAQDIDWTGAYAFQAEAGMKWTLSAVTYALDQEY